MNPNAIMVSKRQEGNPVLKHIRNVRWQFADIVPDYQMGGQTCALFLSLRCHPKPVGLLCEYSSIINRHLPLWAEASAIDGNYGLRFPVRPAYSQSCTGGAHISPGQCRYPLLKPHSFHGHMKAQEEIQILGLQGSKTELAKGCAGTTC